MSFSRMMKMAKMTECTCEVCGKQFTRRACEVRKHTFCTRACARIWNRNRIAEYNRSENPMNTPTGWSQTMRIESRMRSVKPCKKNTYPKASGRHEHRAIAEAILGRKLAANEVVHHKDGDKHNNQPDNLIVMTRSEHSRLHAQQARYKKVR